MDNAQGSMEYLLLIGGGVLVAVIAIAFVLGITATSGDTAETNQNAFSSLIEQEREKALGGGGNPGGDPGTVIVETGPEVAFFEGNNGLSNGSTISGNDADYDDTVDSMTIGMGFNEASEILGITLLSDPIHVCTDKATCDTVCTTTDSKRYDCTISNVEKGKHTIEVTAKKINGTVTAKANLGFTAETIFTIPRGLQAHYAFEGDANDSIGKYNGTRTGGTFETGKKGQALKFNGASDYIALPISFTGANAIPSMTVCTWFKTTFTKNGYNNNWAFIDFDRGEFFTFYLRADNSKLGFSTTKGNTVNDQNGGTGNLNNGQWQFGCAAYDGKDKIIYLNGNEDNRITNAHGGGSLGKKNTRFGFMGDASSATSFNGTRKKINYEGSLDELMYFNRALTGAEIRAIYSNS